MVQKHALAHIGVKSIFEIEKITILKNTETW